MTDYRARLKKTGGRTASRGFKRSIERKLCAWLSERYGCAIDPDDRTTLVDSLSDGVILCKLIRDLSGNRRIKFKAKRPNIFQKNENIRTFSQQCKRMGISDVATLAPSDLRDGATKKVMACLMHLYRQSKDWTAKDGTKEKPGVVKMVFIKPKRAKVEIVTDYLKQLKGLRRNRVKGALAGTVMGIVSPIMAVVASPEEAAGGGGAPAAVGDSAAEASNKAAQPSLVPEDVAGAVTDAADGDATHAGATDSEVAKTTKPKQSRKGQVEPASSGSTTGGDDDGDGDGDGASSAGVEGTTTAASAAVAAATATPPMTTTTTAATTKARAVPCSALQRTAAQRRMSLSVNEAKNTIWCQLCRCVLVFGLGRNTFSC